MKKVGTLVVYRDYIQAVSVNEISPGDCMPGGPKNGENFDCFFCGNWACIMCYVTRNRQSYMPALYVTVATIQSTTVC